MWETRLKVAGYPPTPQGLERLISDARRWKSACEVHVNNDEEVKRLTRRVSQLEEEKQLLSAKIAELQVESDSLLARCERMKANKEAVEDLWDECCEKVKVGLDKVAAIAEANFRR